jgi:transcriptional regulator with XRE-family HTH domain
MKEIINIDWTSMTDNEIICIVGSYIKQERLEQNMTQAQLAHDAGINRSTIIQIENGESVTLGSLIQILRVLDRLNILKVFSVKDKISPIEYAKLKVRQRKRASPSSNQTDLKKGDIGW